MALSNVELLNLLLESTETKVVTGNAGADGVGIASITQDDESVLIALSDGTIETLVLPKAKDGERGEAGRDGIDGLPGLPGLDGKDGKDGTDGIDGITPAPAVGITTAVISEGRLLVGFSDGSHVDAGSVIGPAGERGATGSDGQQGKNGGSILSGEGPPRAELGNIGDFYIDLGSQFLDFYGPKTDGKGGKAFSKDAQRGGWGLPMQLRSGPVGASGSSGGGGSGGGAVASVSVTAPIVNSGTAANPIIGATLAAVATSGDYADLINQPTLGTAAATASTDYATAAQGATADAASAALATKADLVNGVVPTSQIPAVALTQYLGTVANQAAMLALTGQGGDFCIRSDSSHTWVITGSNPASINDWIELVTPTSDVTSVNSQTGAVVLAASDVGAATTAQGALADSAVQSVSVTAPIVNSGTAKDLALELGTIEGGTY